MTPKERLLAALQHRPADRVPVYHAGISSRAASIVLGREAYVGGGIQQWREASALWEGEDTHADFLQRTRRDTFDIARALEVDLVRPSYWRMPEKPARKIDQRTFLYGEPDGDYRVMRFDPGSELYQTIDSRPNHWPAEEDLEEDVRRMEEDLDAYHPTPETFPDIVAAVEEFGDERSVAGLAGGVALPTTIPAWFEMVAARPDLVQRYLDLLVEYALRNVDVMSRLDVHVMYGGGDLATNTGPIYSPTFFAQTVVPRVRKLTDACHGCGKHYFFASDGNLWPVSDDLFPAIDGYYEIDRRAGMDLRRLRERFPELVLVGNISSHTLHLGTKDEVIEETLSCLEAAKELGGIIVGCSNLIVCQTPEENLLAMLETIERCR